MDLANYEYKKDGLEYDYQTKKFLEAKQAPVSLIKETRQNNNDGSTLHIELDLTNTSVKYLTAQNLAIFPENTKETVEELAKLLNLNLDQVCIFLIFKNFSTGGKSSEEFRKRE